MKTKNDHLTCEEIDVGKQLPENLRKARVHVSGTGRIGSQVVINLVSAGIHTSANDPQAVDTENVGSLVFVQASDVGRKKVDVLKDFLHDR